MTKTLIAMIVSECHTAEDCQTEMRVAQATAYELTANGEIAQAELYHELYAELRAKRIRLG